MELRNRDGDKFADGDDKRRLLVDTRRNGRISFMGKGCSGTYSQGADRASWSGCISGHGEGSRWQRGTVLTLH